MFDGFVEGENRDEELVRRREHIPLLAVQDVVSANLGLWARVSMREYGKEWWRKEVCGRKVEIVVNLRLMG